MADDPRPIDRLRFRAGLRRKVRKQAFDLRRRLKALADLPALAVELDRLEDWLRRNPGPGVGGKGVSRRRNGK